MSHDPPVKVTVSIITYNHERFIAKALDSVLMQQTNFEYEIIVGEDCSTDNTRSIIRDFQARYPGRLRVFFSERNLGVHGNFEQVSRAWRGEYVALLEGDDYWTSPYKLQKQVDFLDSHPECTVCFHNAHIVFDDGSRETRVHCPPDQAEFTTLEDLLVSDYIPTCSTMFRRGLFGDLPEWVNGVRNGDWAMHILNAQYGKLGYINEVMGVYLKHQGGIWTSLQKNELEHDKAIIAFYDALSANLDHKYEGRIRRIVRDKLIALTIKCRKAGDLAGARVYGLRCLRDHAVFEKWLLTMLLESYFPRSFERLRSVKRRLF